MGNKPSRTSKSDVNSDIQHIYTPPEAPKIPLNMNEKEKVLLLGTSDVGKSTFFLSIKQFIPKNPPEYSQKEFQRELQSTCSRVINQIWYSMSRTERIQFKESLPIEIKSSFDKFSMDERYRFAPIEITFDRFGIDHRYVILEDAHNCAELLLKMWKIPFLRMHYDSVCRSETCSVYENVKELIDKIELKQKFNPLSLCHFTTQGIKTFKTQKNGIDFEFYDVGGRRNQYRSFAIRCYDQVQTLIYVVSLSDFNQYLIEEFDTHTMRMFDSFSMARDASGSQYFADARKILLFTKPDILIKKLNQGIEYKRELNTTIRPELEGIAQYHEKVVINSIVSEYFKFIEGECNAKIDSYHIINMISEEDVKCVIDIIFGEKSSQKTTFISHCLLEKTYEMQSKLFKNCLNGNLTDIHISTNPTK